jgi:hypothetical protein
MGKPGDKSTGGGGNRQPLQWPTAQTGNDDHGSTPEFIRKAATPAVETRRPVVAQPCGGWTFSRFRQRAPYT